MLLRSFLCGRKLEVKFENPTQSVQMQRRPELSVEILNVIVHYEETCPEKVEIFRPIPFFNILLLQFFFPFHPTKGHFSLISTRKFPSFCIHYFFSFPD